MFLPVAVLLAFLGVLSTVEATAKRHKLEFHKKEALLTRGHPLLPKGWGSVQHLQKQQAKTRKQHAKGDRRATEASATSYIITSSFGTSSTCEGTVNFNTGFGLGVCLVGIDINGNVAGSVIYDFLGQDSNTIRYQQNVYTSTDCTGDAVHSELHMAPSYCFPGSDAHTSYSFSVYDAKAVSKLGPSLLVK